MQLVLLGAPKSIMNKKGKLPWAYNLFYKVLKNKKNNKKGKLPRAYKVGGEEEGGPHRAEPAGEERGVEVFHWTLLKILAFSLENNLETLANCNICT